MGFDVGAAAAVAAAAVVTWQSWETRKAAQASRDAVGAANEGLELSRQQAAEATRARIDAATPRITVQLPTVPDWPPLEPSVYLGGHPQPHSIGPRVDALLTPRDSKTRILVRAPVTIINESDAHVRLEVGELTSDDGAAIAGPLNLGPREQFHALFAVIRTLDEWIAVFNARAAGEPGEPGIGFVRFMDPADTGSIDRWELVLSGCPLERVADVDSGWRIAEGPHSMGLSPVLRERTYWLSKRQSVPLPD